MSDVTVTLHTEAVMPAHEVLDYVRQLREAGWPKDVLVTFLKTGTGVWRSEDGKGRTKVSTLSGPMSR